MHSKLWCFEKIVNSLNLQAMTMVIGCSMDFVCEKCMNMPLYIIIIENLNILWTI